MNAEFFSLAMILAFCAVGQEPAVRAGIAVLIARIANENNA